MVCKKEHHKNCMCLRRKHDGCSECEKNVIKFEFDMDDYTVSYAILKLMRDELEEIYIRYKNHIAE